MKKNQILVATAGLVMSAALTKKEDKEVEKDPFEPVPVPYKNYHNFSSYAYTPDLTTKKYRKCSNKKYVKRKKAKNGR